MADSGRRLQKARKQLGMSAAELARLAGVSRSEVCRWETGEREVPRTGRVRKGLAKALDKDAVILGGYLDGLRSFADLFPPPPTPLEQALAMERPGRWSDHAVELARKIERDLGEQDKTLTPAEWVRQLDACEQETRKAYKTIWERLMEDDDYPEDQAD